MTLIIWGDLKHGSPGATLNILFHFTARALAQLKNERFHRNTLIKK